ncbi:MAG TPA: hypothetical protein VK421_07115 [Pyrinomonadaceae bacterium]|nr:hypothetical protein [Pyrinomonadaceae bacterium]
MANNRETNLLLVRHVVLPTIFLTVALLGGLRVDAATRALVFVAPPLVSLVLAVLLASLFARGRLVELGAWLSAERPAAENVSHALTLLALFFASAQAFNSVLPEAGIFRWLFSFFFLWTLWQSQFAVPEARRTLRSLAALFGTAFLLKHMLIAALYDPEAGWLRRVAAALFEGVTEGTVGERLTFAPSTGYVSFFALALYILGLVLLPPAPEDGPADGRRSLAAPAGGRELLEDRTRARAIAPAEEAGRLPADTGARRRDSAEADEA